MLEQDAGALSGYPDAAYTEQGASIVEATADVLGDADIVLYVNRPLSSQLAQLKANALVIGHIDPFFQQELVESMADKGLSTLSVEMIPRSSRAQKMDALSSQASLAGYVMMMQAANALPSILPMMMTPSGTIKPAKVFIIGAGVAGLQAIATAKRLGAIVEASDPRSAAREEVLSLGAKFIEVEGAVEDSSAGGYAVKQTKEYLERQKKEVSKRLELADVVISTAQVLGGKSPILIPKSIVDKMRPGSVIIDLASASGGNCEMTQDGKMITYNDIKILGNSYLSADLSQDSSNLFSNNVYNFLEYIINDNKISNNEEDEIFKQCYITKKIKFN